MICEEGIAEKIVVEIPKGQYLPVFLPRPVETACVAPLVLAQEPPQVAEPAKMAWRQWKWRIAGALLLVLSATALLIWWPWTRHAVAASPVDTFWHPFLTGEPPLVIYSNALFKGDSANGLRYALPQTPDHAGPEPLVDTYTGIGELASVYNLTKLFDRNRASFILKRSLLVTWDEARCAI